MHSINGKIEHVAEIKFNRAKSIFKNFQEDTPEHLLKMLEQDINYSKLHKMCKQIGDLEALKQSILKYYLQLKNIFLHTASNSSYPTISFSDWSNFAKDSKLLNNNID